MDSRHVWLIAVMALDTGTLTLPARADTPTTPAASTPAKPDAKASAANPATCPKTTGTHIPLKAGHCVAAPSRSWSREDIDTTGGSTAAAVVRQLGVH